MYNIKNGTDTEYSFFAPDDVHEKIKSLHKGDKFEIVKLAEQKGTKIITKHEVKILPKIKTEVDKKESIINKTQNNGKDSYFESMLNSYEDAIKIQEKLHGIIDINRVAISIFITRNRINGNGYN